MSRLSLTSREGDDVLPVLWYVMQIGMLAPDDITTMLMVGGRMRTDVLEFATSLTARGRAGVAAMSIAMQRDADVTVAAVTLYIAGNRRAGNVDSVRIHSLFSGRHSSFCHLRTLLISEASFSHVSALGQLTGLCVLVLSYCNRLVDISAVARLQLLEQIELRYCAELVDMSAIGDLQTALTSLTVTLCPRVHDMTSVSKCLALQTMYIYARDVIAGMECFRELSNMRKLTLVITEYQPCDLSWIRTLHALQDVRLWGCPSLVDTDGLGHANRLTKLDVSHCYNITDLSAIHRCTSLTSLDISHCYAVDSLRGIVGEHGALKSVDVSSCQLLVDLSPLACPWSRVSSLDVSCCGGLEDISCLWSIDTLTYLNASRCRALTSVVGICNSKNLRSVDLSHCSSLTDIDRLPESLRRLDASSCPVLQNISGLGRLEFLSIHECAKLRKDSLLEAISATQWTHV